MKLRSFFTTFLSVFLLSFGPNTFASASGEEVPYPELMMHHVADANEFHIFGNVSVPLPCILYSKDQGLSVFSSAAFHHGEKVVDGYVMNHGDVMRIASNATTYSDAPVDGFATQMVNDEEKPVAIINGEEVLLDKAASLVSNTSFYDFSISKIVFTLILSVILLFIIFSMVRKGYTKNEGKAPSGIQSFFEPIFVFIRDEVMIPAIGKHKWQKYFPFIASLFFFILFNNLLGLVPFFPGSANVTGNLGVTMALAFVTFLVVNVSGNKHYWEHIVWMPGVPAFVKLILTPIEILGIFIKPITLMIRLFANISAGHIIILSLVGIIFIMGNNGASMGGSIGGMVIAIPFLFMMNILELFVAFLQAFIFALLASLYIGDAVVEAHH